MKKVVLIILLSLPATMGLRAQTFQEWFAQKKTQIKYLYKQIAALQAYMQAAEKGYAIVQKGTEVIGNIKKGDLTLHSDYFASLKNINPAVKGYIRVADIIALQVKILQTYHACYTELQQSGLFSQDEISYVYSVFTGLLSAATANLDMLIALTTAGDMEMSDDERIRRIDGLWASMQKMYGFSQTVRQTTLQEAFQRQREQDDLEDWKHLYGLK